MRLIKLLFFVAVFLSLTTVAYAHPGGTDSEGGHHDRSTGEYHFHHGYSAHQHSDFDGDGTLDCPYEFDDKTDHSSTKSTPTLKIEKSSSESQETENSAKEDDSPKSGKDIANTIGLILGISCIVAPCVFGLVAWLVDLLRKWRSK